MKKIAAVLAVVVLVVSMVSMVFAADTQKGTIKSVDAKAGTVVFCADGGKDVTLKADKAVDLTKVKAGDKIEASIEKDALMGVKAAAAAKPKAAVGC
jgi:hypothetical protein